jgi:hypothetical protein
MNGSWMLTSKLSSKELQLPLEAGTDRKVNDDG